MVDKALFSSDTCEWETPQDLFDIWDTKYHFTLDVCATKKNTKCKVFYSKKEDGLAQLWGKHWWCNPPYGRGITGLWVKKAFYNRGGVMLLPARTDTRWFHDYIYEKKGVTITFLKGRLTFGGAKNPAPFPSMIVEFK